jgi:hypothetical protein
MNDHLTHSRLFAELSNLASSEYTTVATDSFGTLEKSVTEPADLMVRDFHTVVTVNGQWRRR